MSITKYWGDLEELQYDIWDKKYRHNYETFDQWLDRVSGNDKSVRRLIEEKKFLFGGRILAHRGIPKKVTYSNCYVLPPVEDNIESIFETAKMMARTYSMGGGVGVDISGLRPRGSRVRNSANETTGAVSFMELFDLTTALIGQNGRRGALMISISDKHPDIEEFLGIKTKNNSITKANISVRLSDEFMEMVKVNGKWKLEFTIPETGEKISKIVDARRIFEIIAKNNWDWAEPGALFWDRINNWHLMSEHPEFEYAGVNPCAEEPLPGGGACLLGSINLAEFVTDEFKETAKVDVKAFKKAVRTGVIGLNQVLDEGIYKHPLEIQRHSAMKLRQIGLGVMGFGDMLIKLGIRYGSNEAFMLVKQLGNILANEAAQQSARLARVNGAFPLFDLDHIKKSKYYQEVYTDETKAMIEEFGLYNSQILSIAPTGSLSTMLGISGGVEPLYNTKYWRKTESLHGEDKYYEVLAPIVQQAADANGGVEPVVDTAMTLDWRDRLEMQGIWQHYIDAAISSTVNLPSHASVTEVEAIYLQAWEKGLKGVTIFRDGCQRAGILTNQTADDDDTVTEAEYDATAYQHDTKYSSCENCGEPIKIVQGGCTICLSCGHSPCA